MSAGSSGIWADTDKEVWLVCFWDESVYAELWTHGCGQQGFGVDNPQGHLQAGPAMPLYRGGDDSGGWDDRLVHRVGGAGTWPMLGP